MTRPIFSYIFFISLITLVPTVLTSKSDAYFSPYDNVEQKIIDIINKTKRSISIAIYQMTSKPLFEALVSAMKRGVSCEVVTEGSTFKATSSKTLLLRDLGVPTYVFKPQRAGLLKPLMHCKYALFDIDGKEQLVIFGSYNWTKMANTSNREHLTVSSNKSLFSQYKNNFEKIKKECVLKNKKDKKSSENSSKNSSSNG